MSVRAQRRRVLASLALASMSACVSQPPTDGSLLRSLPTDAELMALARRPLRPYPAAMASGVRPKQWRIEPSSLKAERFAQHNQLLAQLGLEPSASDPALNCAATELASFMWEYGARPIRATEEFIVRRCGMISPSYDWLRFSPNELDAPELQELLSALTTREAGESFGLGFGDASTAVLLRARAYLRLTGTRITYNANTEPLASFEFDLLRPASRLDAVVTSGSAGFARCLSYLDGSSGELHCPLSATDAHAYVEIHIGEGSELVLAARLWVSPDASQPTSLRFDDCDGAALLPDLIGPELLIHAINERRREHALPELVHQPQQSEDFDMLMSHYLAAQHAGDLDTVETIARGLSAGWSTPAPLLYGDIALLQYDRPECVPQLLEELEFRPGLRASLLHDSRHYIGLAVASEPGHVGRALIGTYAGFIEFDTTEARRSIYASIDRARSLAGRPAAHRPDDAIVEAVLDRWAGAVAAGRVLGQDALREAIWELGPDLQEQIMGGSYLTLQTIEDFAAPASITGEPEVSVSVGLAKLREPDHAWGSVVVLLVYRIKLY